MKTNRDSKPHITQFNVHFKSHSKAFILSAHKHDDWLTVDRQQLMYLPAETRAKRHNFKPDME